jgi:hypothetical protein
MKINHEDTKSAKTFFYSFFVFFVSSWLFSDEFYISRCDTLCSDE